MPDFTTLPIPYVPIGTQAAAVRSAIDAAQLSGDNSFGGLQNLAIRGPFLSDAEADANGVPVDNLYYQPNGTVRAASHLSLDLQFATDKTLTARVGPTPTFTRASGATYVGSDGLIQSAAVDEPRFDHDPVTLACKGLLIEEGRTNLAWYASSTTGSSNLTPPDGSTLTNNFGVAPDGTTTTALIADNSTLYTYGISLNSSTRTAFAANSTVCGSLYIRKKTSAGYEAQITLSFGGGEGGSYSRYRFNYVTGVALSSGDLAVTSTSVSVLDAGDFWRIIITAAPTNGSTVANIQIRPAAFNTMGVSDITLTGNIEFWGNQVELGAFPTSLIITSGAPLTRSADVCSITGGDFTGMWNQSEGTLLAQTQKTSTNSNAFVISVSDNSFNNETDLRYNSVSQVASLMNVSNVNQLVGLQANITSGAAVKQSIAYKLNDCAYAANGASPISDTSALIPTVNRLAIGNVAFVGQALYLNGHIAAIRYYKKRLANAKLTQLTT
jgi:hypothetical protein